MKINHIAIYTNDLDQLCKFYLQYFGCRCSAKYENTQKGFESYFLTFDLGPKIEIMKKDSIENKHPINGQEKIGFSHLAVSVGSKERVDYLTFRFEQDGLKIISKPRLTGDGFYESVISDPDGNRIELTI